MGAGSQLALKSRIASTQSLGKIFRAQEMIASTHILKARQVAQNAEPYAVAIDDTLAVLLQHARNVEHPIFRKAHEDHRVGVLAITADRGMAGPYTSNVLRETEALLAKLDENGEVPELYVTGARGVAYYKYRSRDLHKTWTGDSLKPGVAMAQDIADALLSDYCLSKEKGGISEVYIVYTRFINLVSQEVHVLRMLPIELIEDSEFESYRSGRQVDSVGRQLDMQEHLKRAKSTMIDPLYEFEPRVEEVLDDVLPRYIASRIHSCLLTSAASEMAARQNAMRVARDNAKKLIDELTRQLNQSRQASITQELGEIIGSADALKKEE